VVLLQATLTFINIGGGSVWGTMLAQGRNWVLGPGGNLLTYWWVFLPPTLAVMSFGIAWNLFGDSLNDMLVPASRYTFRARKSRKEEAQPSPEAEAVPPVLASAAPAVVSSQVRKAGSPNGADPVLGMAREGVSRGDLPRALHAYEHLIRHNRSIEAVLPDLAQLVKKFPRDPQVWRTLGDALACAGDAEHAAQSYDRARRLT
jgi:hypothetical protein